ncbi:MAG: DUF721 domain-containing protein [bacterium]
MFKGKPPFVATCDSGSDAPSDFASAPVESSYQVKPTLLRRRLTPRDQARNCGVKKLFDHVTPGLPIDADPAETRQEPEKFSDLIEKTLKKLNLTDRPWFDELVRMWPELVPPDVAKVTRPGKWDAGILYVYVTSSVHLFEVRRSHLKRIEQAVRAFADDDRIKQVRLMVNSVPLPYP